MSQLSSSLVDASKFVTLIKLVFAANCIDTTPRLRSHLGSNAETSPTSPVSSKYSSLVSPSQRTRSQSTNNETSSGGKDKQLPAVMALAPAAAAVFGGAAEQSDVVLQTDTADHVQRNQSKPDDEDENLKDLSQGKHRRYKVLEKQVAEIVRDPNGELRIKELTAAEKVKFFQLVDQMAEILEDIEMTAASTSASTLASHDGVADVASSAVFAMLTEIHELHDLGNT